MGGEHHCRICLSPDRAASTDDRLATLLYFAETVKVEERLLDVVEGLNAEDVVIVNPLSEVVRSLPGFELSE